MKEGNRMYVKALVKKKKLKVTTSFLVISSFKDIFDISKLFNIISIDKYMGMVTAI